jgi:hypothetical protein
MIKLPEVRVRNHRPYPHHEQLPLPRDWGGRRQPHSEQWFGGVSGIRFGLDMDGYLS